MGFAAPERGQECQDRLRQPYDCGGTAVRALVDLTKGHDVNCEAVGEDRSGRTLAICRLPSGLDLKAELVRQGRAVAFCRYRVRYIVEEDEARLAGRRMWAGTFEHPGCWRAQLRGDACKDVMPKK